jgi:hypothetical protein
MGRFLVAPLTAALLVSVAGSSLAQTTSDPRPAAQPGPQSQNPPGPLNTDTTKGAPAESPQGETPPGMQSAPQGSGVVAPAQPPGEKKK